jgi:NADPH:quinone reductase-like Zn-dependent oxidoreductase
MKAVGLYKYLPIEDPQPLVDLYIPQPNTPVSGDDLQVAIKAVSVNPVDTKVRRGLIPITIQIEKNIPRIFGWDASGVVVEAGSDCTLFKKYLQRLYPNYLHVALKPLETMFDLNIDAITKEISQERWLSQIFRIARSSAV